jgi:hypothetical protein
MRISIRARRTALGLIALAAFGGVAAVGAPPAAASYRGAPVTTRDAPWLVVLTYWGVGLRPDARLGAHGFAPLCSGAVIAPRRVLTAAHCIDGYDLKLAAVNVGMDDGRAGAGRVLPIARAWMLDKEAFAYRGHDLAVIETQQPLGAPPIPLASDTPQVGEHVSSYGYGGTKRVDDDAGGLMPQRLDALVVGGCTLAADPYAICTRAPNGGGIRGGDSGGPLVVLRDGRPQLAGVTSATDATGGTLDVFADATTQASFIGAPPDAALFPIMRQRELRIAGRLRPGATVSCPATFAPAPHALHYRWFVGPSRVASGTYRDHRGVYWRPARPIAHRRSVTIPRDAAGEPIHCALVATIGPSHQIELASAVRRIAGAPHRR